MVKTTILVKMTLFRTGFSIRRTKMVHFGPFWPKEVHLVHVGPSTVLWPFLNDTLDIFENPYGPP